MDRVERTWAGPPGWVATAVGGSAGAAICSVIGYQVGIAYADATGMIELDALMPPFIGAASAGFLGAVTGTALALRMRGHSKPIVSGIVFAISAVLLLIACAFLAGQVFHEWDEGVGVVLTLLVTSIPSALLARGLFGRKS